MHICDNYTESMVEPSTSLNFNFDAKKTTIITQFYKL